MAEVLRLFVSATHDLEAERATIGRALARLPVQTRIEIRRTAAAGAPLEEMHEQIANVDRFYFLMGEDISAPAGAEWHLAWKLERSVLALRRGTRATPAAQQFLHMIPVRFVSFATSAAAARIVALDVANILLHPANRYGLTVREIEQVTYHADQLRKQTPRQAVGLAAEAGGAEGGGVLLDSGRYEPIQGVALDEEG